MTLLVAYNKLRNGVFLIAMVEFGGGYVHRKPKKKVHQTQSKWGVVFEEYGFNNL